MGGTLVLRYHQIEGGTHKQPEGDYDMSKYTIYDASQYIKVGETDSELEALKMRDRFLDSNPASDCTIEDESGKHFDDDWTLSIFVAEIVEQSSEDLQPMTEKEALRNMMEWFRDGVEIPEDMTPEILAYYWNEELKELAAEKAAKIEAQDDQIATMNPDCLRFRKAYEDGSSAFFDPDQLTHDLIRTGYDETHREIIAKAMMAYLKVYNQ